MTIQLAVVCDAAMDYNGKLSLLGTFDTIYANVMPAIHPQCSIALRIIFTREEEGNHLMQMNFVDEDGKPIMPKLEAPIEVVVPAGANYVSRNFIMNIQQLKFERPGDYAVDVAMNSRHMSSVPLSVRQAVIAPE